MSTRSKVPSGGEPQDEGPVSSEQQLVAAIQLLGQRLAQIADSLEDIDGALVGVHKRLEQVEKQVDELVACSGCEWASSWSDAERSSRDITAIELRTRQLEKA